MIASTYKSEVISSAASICKVIALAVNGFLSVQEHKKLSATVHHTNLCFTVNLCTTVPDVMPMRNSLKGLDFCVLLRLFTSEINYRPAKFIIWM